MNEFDTNLEKRCVCEWSRNEPGQQARVSATGDGREGFRRLRRKSGCRRLKLDFTVGGEE